MSLFRSPSALRDSWMLWLVVGLVLWLAASVDAEPAPIEPPASSPAGAWYPTGSMTHSRSDAAVVLLPSGQVLVVDGTSAGTAELYDPMSGTWTAAARLLATRRGHTATLLPDGRVLVAGGGLSCDGCTEIYDPSSDTWSVAAPLASPRNHHTATLLPSGKVLIVGGWFGYTVPEAELYDPQADAWSIVGSLATPRLDHTATLLPSGEVLIVGGRRNLDLSRPSLASVERFDPIEARFVEGPSLTGGRVYHTATLLPSGRVLVTGGSDVLESEIFPDPLASAELYDPEQPAWVSAGTMSEPRESHRATLLPSGKVMITGGSGDSVEVYDPAAPPASAWSDAVPMEHERDSHLSTLLPSGVLLVAGPTGTAELYRPFPEAWATVAELAHPRARSTATVLPSGDVVVAGGEPEALGRTERYDPVQRSWSAADTLDSGRLAPTASLLPSGEVLVVGGAEVVESRLDRRPEYYSMGSVEVYDPEENAWRATSELLESRFFHTATRLASGSILVVGGCDEMVGVCSALSSTEVYDPETGSWTATGSLHDARARHTATLLPSGKVLVTGGIGETLLASAELYDPAVGIWSRVAAMRSERLDHTATLLPSGEVLVAGGVDGVLFAERFDPTTGVWTTTGSLSVERSLHSATLLPSGDVLVVGGTNGYSTWANAELYDLSAGRWTSGGSLVGSRAGHSAVLLHSGDVLVIGGGDSLGGATRVEIFDPDAMQSAERQPVIDQVHGLIAFDHPSRSSFRIEGRFRGDSEANDGSRSSTVANLPFVHLRSLDGSVQQWLEPDAVPPIGPPPWDGNIWDEPMTLTFSSLPATLPPGQYVLTVSTAGVRSEPVHLEVACSIGFGTPQDRMVQRLDATAFEIDVPGAVSYQWETCHGDRATTCRPPADPLDPTDTGGPGWRPIVGATGQSLDTGPVQGAESGSLYRVLARGLCAQRRSEPATLTVHDTTPPGETDGLPPVDVVAPRGGELWPLSRDGELSVRDIAWTMSDDVRVCGVDVRLLHSDDGGQTFPRSLSLQSFGSGPGCFEPGELTTRLAWEIPATRPFGGTGSLYKVEVTVTDHAGNATTAASERPFYLVEPNNESIETLILWHPDRMRDLGMPTDDLAVAVANLADHPAVQGRVVDLGLPEALGELYDRWDAGEVDTSSLLFGRGGLRDYLHDQWLANFPAVEHLILVGDDRLIPFARLPDGTAAAAVPVSEEAYPSDPGIDPDVDLTSDGTAAGAALAANHYLSDDPLATRGTIRPNDLDDTIFLPDLGVGRLVETPSEMIASIAGFLSSEGVVDLTRRSRPVFVSAYDFLVDAGARIEERWRDALGDGVFGDGLFGDGVTETLIGQDWTSSDLVAGLCGRERVGVVSLNGHATHYQVGHPSAGGPYVIEGTSTSDLTDCDFTGSLVYAVGCHSGLSVADDTTRPEHDHPRDMPQAMLGAGALAFLGNTGYGWGLKYGVGYSERLVELFTQELTLGGGVEIGDAVRRAKTRYYLESPYFDTFDEKVSMQWTLYGFPMLRLRTGAPDAGTARPFADPPPRSASVPYRQKLGAVTVERRIVGTTVVDGVEVVPPPHVSREPRSFDFRGDRVYKVFNAAGEEVGPGGASPDHCDRTAPDPDPNDEIPQGCYYTLNGLVNGQDVHSGATDRPLQPLLISDVGLSGTRFHGFLWLGGTYVEQRDWVPLFAELQSNVDGGFSDRGFLPSNSRSNGRGKIRHGGVLGDACAPSNLDRTSLVLEAGEVLRDAAGTFSIERHYETIETELFYYNNADDPAQNCDITGPRVVAEHSVSGSRIAWTVRAHVDESDPIWRVVVVWTDNTVDAEGRGRWQPLELESIDGVFEGSLDVFGSTRLTYFVQAVDERGNVSVVSALDPRAASGVVHELPELVDVDLAMGTADLAITLDATPDPVPGLTTLTTVVEVANHGPDTAGAVSVAVELPDALTDVGVSGEGWTCSEGSPAWRCTRSTLASGSIASLRVFGTAPHEGSVELRATVTASSQDPAPGNNVAEASVDVIEAPWTDLAIHHEVTLHRGIATLRIQVTNHGPRAADPATVVTQLSPALYDLSWLCVAGPRSTCTSSGVGPIVDRVHLAADDWLRYRITARVAPDVRSVIETIARVTPPSELYDPDPSSNRSVVTLDLTSPLFSDDFESETLDAWTIVSGLASARDGESIRVP